MLVVSVTSYQWEKHRIMHPHDFSGVLILDPTVHLRVRVRSKIWNDLDVSLYRFDGDRTHPPSSPTGLLIIELRERDRLRR